MDMDIDSSEDRFLGPARQVALLAFPLEILLNASAGAPQLALEVRIDLADNLALGIRPMLIWYLPSKKDAPHGGGFGGAISVQYYLDRPLSGPYVALQVGEVEAFIGDKRGRMFGGSAIFGWAINWDNGAVMTFGVGLGYWHRFGVLDTGIQWPEILSLRIGAGWGFGGPPALPDDPT